MVVSPTLIAEHRLVRRLRHSGAQSAATARELSNLGWLEQRRLQSLRSRAIVQEPQPGLFYLDEAAYAQLRAQRVRIALGVGVLLLAAYAVLRLLRSWA